MTTTISIVPEPPSATEAKYRAFAGHRQSVGKTPGEAVDALSAQLSDQESGIMLVVHQTKPDRFFDESQQRRLAELMQHWRKAREQGTVLDPAQQTELEQLTMAELDASRQRASALLNELRP